MGGVWGNFEPLNQSSRMHRMVIHAILGGQMSRQTQMPEFMAPIMPRNNNSRYYTMLTALVSFGMCHDHFSTTGRQIAGTGFPAILAFG